MIASFDDAELDRWMDDGGAVPKGHVDMTFNRRPRYEHGQPIEIGDLIAVRARHDGGLVIARGTVVAIQAGEAGSVTVGNVHRCDDCIFELVPYPFG